MEKLIFLTPNEQSQPLQLPEGNIQELDQATVHI
jgi:hypothetical protein